MQTQADFLAHGVVMVHHNIRYHISLFAFLAGECESKVKAQLIFHPQFSKHFLRLHIIVRSTKEHHS